MRSGVAIEGSLTANLLDDAVFFALILEDILGKVFVFVIHLADASHRSAPSSKNKKPISFYFYFYLLKQRDLILLNTSTEVVSQLCALCLFGST